jgi:hypothetical protein
MKTVIKILPKQIKVADETHERLSKLVEFKGETFDQIINKCINAYEEKRRKRGA